MRNSDYTLYQRIVSSLTDWENYSDDDIVTTDELVTNLYEVLVDVQNAIDNGELSFTNCD